jgi:hypothetical protein
MVVIALAVLAGCGGSSSKTGSGASSDTNANGGSSSSDLSKLVADASKQKYKITYDNGGSSLTYAQDGNGNSVFGDGDSLTFVSKDATVICDKSSGSWKCTQQSPAAAGELTNPFLGVLQSQKAALSALGDNFGHTTDTKIAGRDAQCLTFSQQDIAGGVGGAIAGAVGAKLKGSATYCIDKQTGITLEVSGTDDSGKKSTVLAVTKFETPSASEFTPPATAQKVTVPTITIPGGGTLPNITLPTIPGGG